MEQIELVIKIPKYVYDMIFDADRVIDADSEIVANAIKSGTILPKGHGRLIEARDIGRIPTIIEADKEGQKEND